MDTYNVNGKLINPELLRVDGALPVTADDIYHALKPLYGQDNRYVICQQCGETVNIHWSISVGQARVGYV